MSLRRRTLLMISASLLGVILLVFGAAHAVLLNGYKKLEIQHLESHIESLTYLINFEARTAVEHMGIYTRADSAAPFIEGTSNAYLQDVLTEDLFARFELSQIYIFDSERQVLYSDGVAESLLPGLEESLSETEILFQLNTDNVYPTGYVQLHDEIYLVAGRPILDPVDAENTIGTMVWVRRFNSDSITSSELHVEGEIEWLNSANTTDVNMEDIHNRLLSAEGLVSTAAEEQITGYILMPTIEGHEPIIMALHQPRQALMDAEQQFLLLGIILAVVAAGFGLMTALLLERMGTTRSQSVQDQLEQIMESNAFHNRIELSGADHFAKLTAQINKFISVVDHNNQLLQKTVAERDTLLKNLPIALLQFDKSGGWQAGTGRALADFGIEQSDAANKSLIELFPTATDLREINEQALHGEHIHRIINLSDDVSAEGWFIPIWENGGVSGVYCVLLNRTQLSQLQDKLNEAEQAAEAAHNAKATFLANMSHELRTPLNAIIGFTGIMMMGRSPEDKDLYRMERIRANGERLLELIDDILDLSRIEAGRMILIPIEVNVRETVSMLSARYERDARDKGVLFQSRIKPGVPDVLMVDQDALEKIVRNLLSNAVKFTESGEIHLEMDVRDKDLVITVSDTGIGIPPHMHEVIFESFRQVDPSATRAYGGTGLGLSLVHNLCLALGGKIQLESATEQGTTFTVTLPLIAQESRV